MTPDQYHTSVVKIKGEPLMHKFYEDFPIWDLKSCNYFWTKHKLYGTTYDKNKYNPFYLKINPLGRVEAKSPTASVYNTILRRVAQRKFCCCSSHKNRREQKIYIVVHKIDVNDEVYIWSTPIATEVNEDKQSNSLF